jgi:hypothetical protein
LGDADHQMRQWQNYYSNTNNRTGCWKTNTKTIKTETSLHLNLGNFLWSLWFSNACLAHFLSMFISLALFFVCLVGWLVLFPFFFTFIAVPLLSPFYSRYHHCYYYKLDNTELHTV